MSAPQHASAQQRTLSGTLAKTPMPRLLASASTARVTGTLELASAGESATVTMVQGMVTKVKTSAPVAYLGSVLYELGFIDSDVLNATLRELARMKWLHGEILLTREAITAVQLAEGLCEQTTRKLVHLFSLPPETTYAFETDVDKLASWGGTDWPHVDPLAAVWRGVRDGLALDDVATSLARAQTASFRLVSVANPKRFDLNDAERAAVEQIRGRPQSLDEIVAQGSIDTARAKALVYFLLVTKQAELVDTSGVHAAYRPPVTPSGSMAAAYTKPTVREMAAVQAPASGVTRSAPPADSRWGEVGPIASYPSSSKIAIAAAPARESAKVPIASPSAPAATAPATRPSRTTLGGVAPSGPPARTSSTPSQPSAPPAARASFAPPAARAAFAAPASRAAFAAPASRASFLPSQGVSPSAPPGAAASQPPASMSQPPVAASQPPASVSRPPVAATPPPRRDSGALSARVIAELDARKVSIHERSRKILNEDHYQRLSLPRDAQPQQVEDAFLALRNLWDPDLLPPALDEAKDDCAFVMSCLLEAYTTLRSPQMREEYTRRMGVAAFRVPSDQAAEDLAASGAADFYEGALACFAKNDNERAERLARRAVKQNPEAAGALALLGWLEAQRPANQSVEETRKRIAIIERGVRIDEHMEQAQYWRGMLYKRIENHNAAVACFRKVVAINPKNMDAVRELRVYEMRIRRNSISMAAVKK